MNGQAEKQLRETVLANEHRNLNAKMVPFAGWNMPVQYSEGILAEHQHTRKSVSLFDICHMGEFRVKGASSAEALDRVLARAVADQKTGTCRYNFLLNEKGGVLDDLIVYRLADDEFYIVVNAGTREHDAAVLRERLGSAAAFEDESDMTAKLDLQGPLSAEILRRYGFDPESLPGYYKFIRTQFSGVPCLLSRTGYTGELGFELYFHADHAVPLWRSLLSHEEVKPAGLGARDTLRLEMGYALYGHELNEDTTPVEAGAAAMLKLETTSRVFPGSDALRNTPPAKRLIGLLMEGRRTARAGDIVLADGREAGRVTSGVFAPSLGCAAAMAYVIPEIYDGNVQDFEIQLVRGTIKARRTELPFYKEGTARKKI